MIGHHTIWDIYDCAVKKIAIVDPVKIILNAVVKEINLTKISESYKQFSPHGASGFILLEESHISIHTWPEHHFAAIDIFSCREFDVQNIDELLKKYFETQNVVTKIINRGILAVDRKS